MKLTQLLSALVLLPSLVWADYASVVTADGATHYYHLGETSGTNADDQGSLGTIDGTYTGGFTLNQTGIPGYTATNGAVTLNGSSGYVALTTSSDFVPGTGLGTGWSFEAWIFPTSSAQQAIVSNNSATQSGLLVQLVPGGTFAFTIDSDAAGCSGGGYGSTGLVGSWTTSQWYHVVATTLGAGSTQLSRMRLYVNGSQLIEVTSFTGGVQPCFGQQMTLGKRGPSSTLWFTGTLDEAAFYKDSSGGAGELSAAKVLSHYNAGLGLASINFGRRIFQSRRDQAREKLTRLVGFDVPLPGYPFREEWQSILKAKIQQWAGPVLAEAGQ